MRDLCGVTSQRAAFDFSTYSFMFFSFPLNSQIVTYLLNFTVYIMTGGAGVRNSLSITPCVIQGGKEVVPWNIQLWFLFSTD